MNAVWRRLDAGAGSGQLHPRRPPTAAPAVRSCAFCSAAQHRIAPRTKAEHERQGVFLKPERAPDDEPRKPAPWNLRRAASVAN